MSELALGRRPVEVDCQPAQWSRSNARYIRSVLNPALADAESYLGDVLGVAASHSRVLPYTSCLGKKSRNIRAFAQSESLFYILLAQSEVKNRKLGALSKDLTSVCAHEMMHCVRLQFCPVDDNLHERIVTEGLAYTAQAYLEIDMFGTQREDTVLEDELDAAAILEELAVSDSQLSDVVSDYWMYDETGNAFSWGDRLGIHCVKYWLEDYGTDFPTLLSSPAEEILQMP